MPDQYVLLTDQPWVDGIDPLGFDDVAGRLADLVLSSRESSPLAIGVLGGWGSGKSSLMRRLDARLKRAGGGDVETVWFNAWTAEGKSSLEGLIKSVLAAIGPQVLRRALRRRRLVSGLRLVLTVGLSWLGAGRLVDGIWDTLSADAKTRNELRDLLREAMEDWQRRRHSRSRRLLVIFVDDLDRCSPANVVEVFEAVKLYLDAPGFVFVIGYDDGMVARALHDQKAFEDAATTARYLEKIIQIDYRLPRPDERQAVRLVDDLVVRSGTAALLGAAERTLIADRTERNPRRVKRFLNNFVLARRLDPAAAEFTARESILLRLLAISFPGFYDLLVTSTEREAMGEFLDYVLVHDWARRLQDVAADRLEAVFRDHRVPAPFEGEPRDASLERLRGDVDERILALAEDRDFRSLLESFGTAGERLALAERLWRRPRPLPDPYADQGSSALLVPPPLTGSDPYGAPSGYKVGSGSGYGQVYPQPAFGSSPAGSGQPGPPPSGRARGRAARPARPARSRAPPARSCSGSTTSPRATGGWSSSCAAAARWSSPPPAPRRRRRCWIAAARSRTSSSPTSAAATTPTPGWTAWRSCAAAATPGRRRSSPAGSRRSGAAGPPTWAR